MLAAVPPEGGPALAPELTPKEEEETPKESDGDGDDDDEEEEEEEEEDTGPCMAQASNP